MTDVYMVCQMAMKKHFEDYQCPYDQTECGFGESCSTCGRDSFEFQKRVSQVLSILIGLFAAYLSWTCPGTEGLPPYIRAMNATFAFMFGGLYLMYYALIRQNTCYPKSS